MSFDYRGRTMVVTGGAGGIGRAFAGRAAAAGARLVLVDLRPEALRRAVSALPGSGHRGDVCDLTDRDAVHTLVAAWQRELGAVDVLVNNAGMTSTARFDERSVASIERELEVNLTAPLVLTRLMIPLLHAAPDPRVISTVSLGGIFPLGETPIYTGSKFGLRGAMLSIALDLRAKGIIAGSVLPSATDTDMLAREAVDGGNTLQFQDPPQSPDQVARAMMRLLDRPRLEIYPRWQESVLVRAVMLAPNALPRLMRLFEGKGERGHRAYLQKLEREGRAVRTDQGWQVVEPERAAGETRA